MMTYCVKILATIDFSTYSSLVVDHAVALALQQKAELLFVNVVNQRDIDMIRLSFDVLKNFSENLSIEGLTKKLHLEREKRMNQLMAQIDCSELNSRFITRIGGQVQEFLKVIEEEDIDVVIIGAKGRHALEDAVIGSTALKMFRRCPVTLVTVRQKQQTRPQDSK